ncbi:MAG: hypothetical protein V4727_13480 [Verrucomicrobiota bacterium]
MKILTRILAVIGALAILIELVGMGVRSILPDQLDLVREHFQSPEVITAISELYAKIEANPLNAELKVEDNLHPHLSDYSKVRRIPTSWLAVCLQRNEKNKDLFLLGNTVAYYDEEDSLIGIEIGMGSTVSCFVSRDSTRCPSTYTSIHRIAKSPLNVVLKKYYRD